MWIAEYIFQGEKEKATRKIYFSVDYTPFEREQIANLEKYLKEQNIKLPHL